MGEKRGILLKSPQLFLMPTYGIERISSFSDAFFWGFSRRNIHTLIFTTQPHSNTHKKKSGVLGETSFGFLDQI